MLKNVGTEILKVLRDSQGTPEENNLFDASDKLLAKFSLTIKERKLGKPEFRFFRDFSNAASDLHGNPALLSAVFHHTAAKKGKIKTSSLSLLSMAPTCDFSIHELETKTVLDTLDPNELSPFMVAYVIQPLIAARVNRQVPISFNIEHVEERFKQRAGIEINNNENNQLAATTVLGMSMLYAYLKSESETTNLMFPIVIPNEHGLFLGYAEACNPLNFPSSIEYADKRYGHFQERRNVGIFENDNWTSKYRFYIRTFIGIGDFFPIQKALWEKFINISSPNLPETMGAIYRGYLFQHEADKLDNNEDVIEYINQLSEILKSPLWASAVRTGLEHMPKETFDQVIMRQILQRYETLDR